MFGLFNQFPAEKMQQIAEEVKSDKAVLVDNRESFEVEMGHIAGAHWMPMSGIQQQPERAMEQLKELYPDKKIYFYCRSGSRSGMIVDFFASMGVESENAGAFTALGQYLAVETGRPKTRCCA
jgi:rhodanese-related sulfurtransferase